MTLNGASATELWNMWTDTSETDSEADRICREDALWEYWRRVADGTIPQSREAFEALLLSPLPTASNAVALLAEKGVIPSEDYLKIRVWLLGRDEEAATWALVHLNAREAVDALREGSNRGRGLYLEALLAKGASWAAEAAMAYLAPEERDYVVGAADARRVFSRRQRHALREVRQKVEKRQREGGGSDRR